MSLSALNLSLLAAFIFCQIGIWAGFKLSNKYFSKSSGFKTPYIAALPILTAIFGSAVGFVSSNEAVFPIKQFTGFAFIGFLLALLGLIKDIHRAPFTRAIPYLFLMLLSGFLASGFSAESAFLLFFIFWTLLNIAALKESSLVYELPFILLSVTAFSQTFYVFSSQQAPLAIISSSAVFAASFSFLFLSFAGKRFYIGDSGLYLLAFAIGITSFSQQDIKIMAFGLLLPAAAFLLPVILAASALVFSYLGNKLYDTENRDKRRWDWILQREQVISFIAIICLALAFLPLLIISKASYWGYVAWTVMFLLSLYEFITTFMVPAKEPEKNENGKIEVLGAKINTLTNKEVLEAFQNYLDDKNEKKLMHVITADSSAVIRANEEPNFKTLMEKAEMIVPDGAGIIWASDFLGTPLPERVPGVALVSDICEIAAKKNYSIFFMGSQPGVAQEAADKLAKKYGMKIAGVEHGYFKPDSSEEDRILEKIGESKADFALIALGVPRQEVFINKLRGYAKNTIAIGVGGSFDVISGKIQRAPVIMQRFGLEWLFRLILEPSRFRRMTKIPVFVLKVFQEKIK